MACPVWAHWEHGAIEGRHTCALRKKGVFLVAPMPAVQSGAPTSVPANPLDVGCTPLQSDALAYPVRVSSTLTQSLEL